MTKKRDKKPGNTIQNNGRSALITTAAEKRLDILTGAVLFAFGVYHSAPFVAEGLLKKSVIPDSIVKQMVTEFQSVGS